jgi:hypothetical protein
MQDWVSKINLSSILPYAIPRAHYRQYAWKILQYLQYRFNCFAQLVFVF